LVIDLIKGYALVSLLKELDGGGNVKVYVEGKLPLISEKMTPELLEKSANAGSPVAQYRMAIGDRQGEGFLLPWKRQQSVETWFLASAKGGNPKAMMQLFGIYREKGDLEQARYWVEQAASSGYEAGVYNYG
jgi:hypothetical protein